MSEDLVSQVAAQVQTFLGDKPWYRSVTVWGLIVYAGFAAASEQACTVGVLGTTACTALATAGKYLGGVMTVLGLRRSSGKATAVAAGAAPKP